MLLISKMLPVFSTNSRMMRGFLASQQEHGVIKTVTCKIHRIKYFKFSHRVYYV